MESHIKHNEYIHLTNQAPDVIPGVAMVFSCTKNDEILVSGLLENFDFCEFFIMYYDDGSDFQYDESKRHRELIRQAEQHGAKWVYLTQPTMRLGPGWAQEIKKHYNAPTGTLCSRVHYFWEYKTDRVRTDIGNGRQIPSFFKIHPSNQYDTTAKIHHIAIPKNIPKFTTPLRRYDFRRLSKQVCLAKADYYESLDGSKHPALRDFSKLNVIPVNPNTIKGIGENELEYIRLIREKYS